MPRSKDAFAAAVLAECGASHPAWVAKVPKGESFEVPIPRNQFSAYGTHRNLIQKLGKAYGCHTCNRKIELAAPVFIVDHIPPREIMGSLSGSAKYRFFPHCDACASRQAALVRKYANTKEPEERKIRDAVRQTGLDPSAFRLKAAKVKLAKLGVDPMDRKLLCGGRFDRSIAGRYSDPSAVERRTVNRIGEHYGCHSCGTDVPMTIYHADHCPPREFGMTAWFPALMEKLGHPLPQAWALRPQCPDCSHQQGTRCRALVTEAERDFLPGSGVIRYRY